MLGPFALWHGSIRMESRAGAPLYGAAKSAQDGAPAIIAFALGGPGTPVSAYRDRDGNLPR